MWVWRLTTWCTIIIMCTPIEDVLIEPGSISTSISLQKTEGEPVCVKCGLAAVTVARTKDLFCLNCFDVYFTHRFRATLGKERLIRPHEKVLVAFSGGESSCVLLQLLQKGVSEMAAKRLQFIPIILYIDEGVALGHSDVMCSSLLQGVLSILSQTQFMVYYTKLEEVFGEGKVWPFDTSGSGTESSGSGTESSGSETASAGSGTESSGSGTESSGSGTESSGSDKVLSKGVEKLKVIFDSISSLTAKENMLLSLRKQLLIKIASQLNVNKILVGDNATHLSVTMLGNIAQGRGGTIPLDTGFCDDRNSDVSILRPLREFPVSEITSYITLHKLQTLIIPSFSTEGLTANSINKLTNSFVTHLQANFPSTTSTIFRIGNKLKINENLINFDKNCSLCQAPCEVSLNEEVFSHVSTSLSDDKESQLCYGCRLTINDTKHKDVLIDNIL